MTKSITVIPVGTPVIVGGEVPAVVIQVCITANNHVQYQCVWWNGNSRNLEWLEEAEVRLAADMKATMRIGFSTELRAGRDYGSLAMEAT